ncbi:hypothetical protein ADK33_15765 [Streptomyces griseus subsp. rhodochrous]|nr:hypothetical protein ADK33_15765 [Streptomyces griseus subsp. rhodochrous]
MAARDLPVGVHRVRSGRYSAQLKRQRRTAHLGTFDTPEEAAAAVTVARAAADKPAAAAAA